MRGTERRSLASSPSTSYSSSVTKFPAWMLFSSPMSYKVKGLFRLAWSHAVCITKWQTYMTRLISICRKQSLANTSVFVLQVSCHLYQILIQKQESFFSTSFNDSLPTVVTMCVTSWENESTTFPCKRSTTLLNSCCWNQAWVLCRHFFDHSLVERTDRECGRRVPRMTYGDTADVESRLMDSFQKLGEGSVPVSIEISDDWYVSCIRSDSLLCSGARE